MQEHKFYFLTPTWNLWFKHNDIRINMLFVNRVLTKKIIVWNVYELIIQVTNITCTNRKIVNIATGYLYPPIITMMMMKMRMIAMIMMITMILMTIVMVMMLVIVVMLMVVVMMMMVMLMMVVMVIMMMIMIL